MKDSTSGNPGDLESTVAVDPYVPPAPEGSATRVRGLAWYLRRSWKNNRREKIWREVCRPGGGPGCGLLPFGLLLLAGFFIWIVVSAVGPKQGITDAPKSPPTIPRALPGPRSAAVLMGCVTLPGDEDENDLISQAGENSKAAMAAGAWQLDTDYKLSQIDMQRVWNLNNRWRPPLNELQDTLIGLAGLTTRGGSWVSHEMCRNDLTLESELIASHAMALSESEPDEHEDLTAGASTQQREARTAQWETLWRRIEESADEQERSSEDLKDFWKSRLEDVRRVHQALLPLLCGLADEPAAQAVIRYYDRYFTDNFPDTSDPEGEE